MSTIAEFLTIRYIKDYIPDTTHPYPFGFVDRGRGATTFLNMGQPHKFLALIEFDPAKGPRGRHKHMTKVESFYVVSGQLRGQYWIDDETKSEQHIHPAGTLITIQPGLFHTLESKDGMALALEISPQSFDLKDHYYPET